MARGQQSLLCLEWGHFLFSLIVSYTTLFLSLGLPVPRLILGKPSHRYEESCLKTEVEGNSSQNPPWRRRALNLAENCRTNPLAHIFHFTHEDAPGLGDVLLQTKPWNPGLHASRPASVISHQCSHVMDLLVKRLLWIEIALLGSCREESHLNDKTCLSFSPLSKASL